MKYKKMINENGSNSKNTKNNLSSVHSYNYNTNQTLSDEKYTQYIIKIQSFFRKYLPYGRIQGRAESAGAAQTHKI